MRVVGIIAEYNPLHNGHIYHMEQAKKQSGADYTVVVMSGNFVQRGEPACIDKFTRARWALEAGADLVIELPSVFAIAPAERFAMGGVRLLDGMGIITDLAFGCENSSLPILTELTRIIEQEPPAFKKALQYRLREGKSYPRARYEALGDIGVDRQYLAEMNKPNNILAMEYLRSLRLLKSSIAPLPIQRIGSEYNDSYLTGEYSSATAIRDALKNGDPGVMEALPMQVAGAMQFDSQFPLKLEDLSPMLLYALRTMGPDNIALVPDVGEGLERLIYSSAKSASSIEALLESVKSRRYTMARCKRIVVSALLHMSDDLCREMEQPENLYYRVLGMKRSARALLSAISSLSKVPILMRSADVQKCSSVARESLRVDALSTDILSYALNKPLHKDSEAAILL